MAFVRSHSGNGVFFVAPVRQRLLAGWQAAERSRAGHRPEVPAEALKAGWVLGVNEDGTAAEALPWWRELNQAEETGK